MARNRRKSKRKEKPCMCDPGMCDHCQYIGEGDFVCDDAPEGPIIVVEDWQPNENYLRCKRSRDR